MLDRSTESRRKRQKSDYMGILRKDPESYAFCTEHDRSELSRMKRDAERYGAEVMRVGGLLQALSWGRPRKELRKQLSSWLEQYLQIIINHSYLIRLVASWNLQRKSDLQKQMPVAQLRYFINNLLIKKGVCLSSQEVTLLHPALSHCLTWSDAYDIADGIQEMLVGRLLPGYPTEGVLPENSEEILERTRKFLPTLNAIIAEMGMKRIHEKMDTRRESAQSN